jgi:hypothetical protein
MKLYLAYHEGCRVDSSQSLIGIYSDPVTAILAAQKELKAVGDKVWVSVQELDSEVKETESYVEQGGHWYYQYCVEKLGYSLCYTSPIS